MQQITDIDVTESKNKEESKEGRVKKEGSLKLKSLSTLVFLYKKADAGVSLQNKLKKKN